MNTSFPHTNSSYPRCVDGRAAVVIVEQGPQFLGASLMFVRF